jgi:large subunit ribosomal protein L24
MSKRIRIKKEDMVQVIAGNDNGKKGKVLKVFYETERVIVEGVNLRKRHTKPNAQNPQGGIIEKELPIHVSNVMFIDPKKNEPTRIGSKLIVDEKTGKSKVARVSVKTGEMLK